MQEHSICSIMRRCGLRLLCVSYDRGRFLRSVETSRSPLAADPSPSMACAFSTIQRQLLVSVTVCKLYAWSFGLERCLTMRIASPSLCWQCSEESATTVIRDGKKRTTDTGKGKKCVRLILVLSTQTLRLQPGPDAARALVLRQPSVVFQNT